MSDWGGSVFGLQFWDGTLLRQDFSFAVLGWHFISGFLAAVLEWRLLN